MTEPSFSEREIYALERPDGKLMAYYAFVSLLGGPFFFLFLIPLAIRFRTLRYRFDDEGVSMRWGGLFQREIHLSYERIQDIHLISNALERRLGLARIKIQTASGSAKAEMTIEGMEAYEELRDFLYTRMRGAQGHARPRPTEQEKEELPTGAVDTELAATLREVARELRLVRQSLEARGSGSIRSEKPESRKLEALGRGHD